MLLTTHSLHNQCVCDQDISASDCGEFRVHVIHAKKEHIFRTEVTTLGILFVAWVIWQANPSLDPGASLVHPWLCSDSAQHRQQ